MKYPKRVLLTPGPLSTSKRVKEAMLYDLGTRDSDFNELVSDIRKKLLTLANANDNIYSAVLLQGSGTYGVESVLTSAVGKKDKLLILENGAYGKRMAEICVKGGIAYKLLSFTMIESLPLDEIEEAISQNDITHVAFIHCETTAGVLNDIHAISALIHKYHKISIVDAMSSFASLPINLDDLNIDFLITSSNKCLHGVPGIAIIFAKKTALDNCKGNCKSLSLDLYEQYVFMENSNAFRFTSPTHVLMALREAIDELIEFGGIIKRHQHYEKLRLMINQVMKEVGFQTLVAPSMQAPIITTYLIPKGFNFQAFYDELKNEGYLLYSGKLPQYDAFRIGNIGDITIEEIEKLLCLIKNYRKDHDYAN